MKFVRPALISAVFVACAGCGLLQTPGRGLPRLKPATELQGHWHVVAEGETLAQLAQRYNVPAADIDEINGLSARESLAAGSKIFVPTAVERVGTRRAATSASKNKDPILSKLKLVWPVAGGTVSSTFGDRRGQPHEGIDIAAPRGTAVFAAAAGTVIYAGTEIEGYGNLLILQHPQKVVTIYAHNHRNLVQEGTVVEKGQVIAEVGNTGRSTGHHLHFELRRGETPQDPLKYLARN